MPSFDELDEAELPADISSKVNLIAKLLGIPPSEADKELRELSKHPAYKIFPTTEAMHRAALEELIANYKIKLLRKRKVLMEFLVIDKTSIRRYDREVDILEDDPEDAQRVADEIKAGKKSRKVKQIPTDRKERIESITASVYGIFSRYGLQEDNKMGEIFGEEFNTKISELTLIDDAVQILPFFEPEKCYRINCSVWFHEDHFRLKITEKELPETVKADLPPIQDIICKLTPPLEIAQISSRDVGRFKLVHGIIKSSRIGISKNDKNIGNLTLTPAGGDRSHLNIIFWNGPEFVIRYPLGSEVYVVCDIQDNEKYGISGIGHFIIPINIPVPKNETLEDSSNAKTSVEVEDWW